ncbi:MAG: SEL1-like repeat protein [Chromatiales bacterium]|nr:SEL1-like repeat protein [Chromatiales bacterium]
MQRLAAFSLLLLALAVPAYAEDEPDIQVRIFKTYLEQATAGDTNSQFIVASRYESGKGTTPDMEKAYEWYERAAAKGHPLAQRKVEERQAARKPTAAVDPIADKLAAAAAVESRGKPVPKPAPAPVRAAPAPKPEPVAAARAPEPVQSINAQQAILGGKWSRQQKPAEYLPSTRATCLQTNASEITCFSEEVTRNVGSNGLTYTVKATLSGVDGRDGRFNLHYVYNVADVNGSPFGQPTSALADANDITARSGWQEPGVKMDCRMSDERSLTRTRTRSQGQLPVLA